jgi:hypothetical protein
MYMSAWIYLKLSVYMTTQQFNHYFISSFFVMKKVFLPYIQLSVCHLPFLQWVIISLAWSGDVNFFDHYFIFVTFNSHKFYLALYVIVISHII